MDELIEVTAELKSHVEVCAVRYDSISDRLRRIEYVVYAVAGAIAMGFLTLLFDVVHNVEINQTFVSRPSGVAPNLAK